MVDIVDCKPEHLKRIKLKPVHDGERPTEIKGNAVSFLIGETPLAIFGWYYICPGVVQVWALVSTEIEKHKKSFHKSVKMFIEYAFETQSLRRMQMSVRVDYPTGWRWAKALGFSCEGVMKGYGVNGMNCWLFAKVKYDRS